MSRRDTSVGADSCPPHRYGDGEHGRGVLEVVHHLVRREVVDFDVMVQRPGEEALVFAVEAQA